MSHYELFGKGRLTWMAIILVTVVSLTLCMLFWENINLMETTKSRMNDDQERLLLLQSEVNGQPILQKETLNQVALQQESKFILQDTSKPNVMIKKQKKTKQKKQTVKDIKSKPSKLYLPKKIEENYYNTEPIYYNPLNHAQCQNALIIKENIDKEELLNTHKSKIKCPYARNKQFDRNKNDAWIPWIWSREFISALKSDRCFEPRTPIRTHKDFYSQKHFNKIDNNIPVFYHIPKCGSSSTAAMTSDLFNFSIHWKLGPERMHEPIHTKCGFAFIRDPIQRFISAYYTINKKIYREMKHQFISAPDRIPERFVDKLNFLMIIGEPQRFERFMDDLFKMPDWWGIEDPLKHISSQTYFLSNWYGSDITYFGRVEHYGQHWKKMIAEPMCSWFKELYAENKDIDLENYEVSHALFHYGTMGISLYNSRNDRQKEYIDALGMREMLDKMYGPKKQKYNISENDVLPPMYYFLTETMYNKIVDFYYQDFVCFGYKSDYNEFKRYVQSKKNPFKMS